MISQTSQEETTMYAQNLTHIQLEENVEAELQ